MDSRPCAKRSRPSPARRGCSCTGRTICGRPPHGTRSSTSRARRTTACTRTRSTRAALDVFLSDEVGWAALDNTATTIEVGGLPHPVRRHERRASRPRRHRCRPRRSGGSPGRTAHARCERTPPISACSTTSSMPASTHCSPDTPTAVRCACRSTERWWPTATCPPTDAGSVDLGARLLCRAAKRQRGARTFDLRPGALRLPARGVADHAGPASGIERSPGRSRAGVRIQSRPGAHHRQCLPACPAPPRPPEHSPAAAGAETLAGPAVAGDDPRVGSKHGSGSVRLVGLRRVRRGSNGVWRSLVARLVRDEEVAGSNPVTPTLLKELSAHRAESSFVCPGANGAELPGATGQNGAQLPSLLLSSGNPTEGDSNSARFVRPASVIAAQRRRCCSRRHR